MGFATECKFKRWESAGGDGLAVESEIKAKWGMENLQNNNAPPLKKAKVKTGKDFISQQWRITEQNQDGN